jgi:arylsulfatase A-like enzyme
MLGSLGRYRKSQPFEESIHIPFLIRYPHALSSGERNEAMFSIVDFMPTLISLAGLPVPENLQGTDFAQAIIHNDASLGPDSVYIEGRMGSENEFRTLRTSRYMLTVDAAKLDTKHLYDTDHDPLQTTNLAGSPEHAELERQLRERLLERAEQIRDANLLSRPQFDK